MENQARTVAVLPADEDENEDENEEENEEIEERLILLHSVEVDKPYSSYNVDG